MQREANVGRIGLTVLAALGLFIAAIWMIGDQSRLFTSKVEYTVQFRNVGGLAPGSPVQLNGVNVGQVEDIVLPDDLNKQALQVHISIESRYSARIRRDSLARIKSFGLLGDKYVEIISGSADSEAIADGGEIPTARQTDVDALIQSGEDVADDLVSTARSLSRILARMDRGEGVLGELVSDEGSQALSERINGIASSLDRITANLDRGEGTLGRLLADDTLALSLESTMARADRVLASFEDGEGVLPALVHDPAYKERLDRVLSETEATAKELGAIAAELRASDGLLPRLLRDEELADQLLAEIRSVLDSLDSIAGKLDRGDGTAAQLINDPAVYEAVNDILVGIDESRILRWLIRNRQKAGIEKRAEELQQSLDEQP
ncbi:MAG: MCE family protein [Acidobacteria bacterium]|nr:MAG: MCE family protein [Acidobacteriota bacterium]REK11645.1 MAG: MCE family protein [Acidobacteriota bacterium]